MVYNILCNSLDVQARVLFVWIKVQPITSINNLRLELGLEALDAFDGPA